MQIKMFPFFVLYHRKSWHIYQRTDLMEGNLTLEMINYQLRYSQSRVEELELILLNLLRVEVFRLWCMLEVKVLE